MSAPPVCDTGSEHRARAGRPLAALSWREELLMDPFPEGWAEIDGALEREFRCRDFVDAIEFVNRVAEVAERADHHPAIEIRWNRVTLRWRTHSAGAITARDIELARRSDELAS